ncbi:MAG: PPP family 3-phenylpropionic acid transporter [Flavobacteriales bacterium]|jgi:PPP family 3-phenylpropionic acid transporter
MPYWRLSSLYFWYFAVVGAMSPYWSLYLKSLGFEPVRIGVLASIPMLVRLFAPNFWGRIADKSGRRIWVLRLGSLGACIFFVGLVFVDDFYLMAMLLVLFGFFWNAIMAQTETITLKHLDDKPYDYGKIRLWGSVGFIAAVLALGFVFERFPVSYLPIIIATGLALIVVGASCLHSGVDAKPQLQAAAGSFISVLRNRYVVAFLVVFFLLQLSHGVYYVFYSIYLEEAGYSTLWIGGLWSLGVVAEIIMFLKARELLSRFTLYHLLFVSLLVTSIRWLSLAFFRDSFIALALLQLTHAFTFALTHTVAIEFIRRQFGEHNQGQGQAFYSAVSYGAGAALGAFISGLIWHYGGSISFVFAGASAAVALLVCYRYLRSCSILNQQVKSS